MKKAKTINFKLSKSIKVSLAFVFVSVAKVDAATIPVSGVCSIDDAIASSKVASKSPIISSIAIVGLLIVIARVIILKF